MGWGFVKLVAGLQIVIAKFPENFVFFNKLIKTRL